METRTVAEALDRMQSVLQRRPQAGLHADSTASARWAGGTRFVTRHPNGFEMPTEMPAEMGGADGRVTPGWLFRAGLAACAGTCIALLAAREGIELTRLECEANSRSDARGLLGMREADGRAVGAGPLEVELAVRIAARAVSAERLRALVEQACDRSWVSCVARDATPVALRIDVG
ncbi:MAG TPA: OsmC family protein [Methylibium sp.]|uniref:OsmC family protein n=1 Tax=Methylibium sp. TaxID=2067992 RepID=UPI002DBE9786|nr:OsmC family protein [Methylibium sp.]HEU4458512.1 OsmC family protein [Methylibium sp.]